MISRLSITDLAQKIQKFAPDLGGIFTFSDLWNIIGLASSDRTAKVVARLVREKALFKIRRNLYTSDQPDLWRLASQIKKKAYISMDSVLARNGLIGTVPAYSVSLVYPGPPQTIKTPFGLLRFFLIQKNLLFGFQRTPFGVDVADNEKAYLDLLYYYVKGARFVIDPLQEVDISKLNFKKLRQYLRAYKNPKFVSFVEGMIREQT
jgi:predicted transcriptional regulator of viral defense system